MAIKIRNKQTGEIKVIDESQASSYGLSTSPTQEPPMAQPSAQPQTDLYSDRQDAGGSDPSNTMMRFLTGAGNFISPKATSAVKAGAAPIGMLKDFIEYKGAQTPEEKQKQLVEYNQKRQMGSDALKEFGFSQTGENQFDPGQYARGTAGGAAQLAAWMTPSNLVKIPKAGAVVSKAVQGGGEALAMNLDDPNFIRNAPTTFLIGTALGGGQAATGKVIKSTFGQLKNIAKKLRFSNFLGKDLQRLSLKEAESVSEKSLQEGVPQDYKKMYEWAEGFATSAEQKLQQGLSDAPEFSLSKNMDFRKKQYILEQLGGVLNDIYVMGTEYRPKGSAAKNVKIYEEAYNKLTADQPISSREMNTIKKVLADTIKSTFGENISQSDSVKKGARATVHSLFLDELRNNPNISKEVSKMLDAQHYALTLKALSDTAYRKVSGKAGLSWYQIIPFLQLGAGFSGAIAAGGAATNNPAVSGAGILGATALGAASLFGNPKGQQILYKSGDRFTGATPGKLADFLRRGATSEINQTIQ